MNEVLWTQPENGFCLRVPPIVRGEAFEDAVVLAVEHEYVQLRRADGMFWCIPLMIFLNYRWAKALND